MFRHGPLRYPNLAHLDIDILPHLAGIRFGRPGGSEAWRHPVGWRRLGVTDAGVAKPRDPPARASGFLPPFHRPTEAERLRSGFDDVRPVCDSVQQRFAESRVWKYRRPFGKR